MDGTGNRSEDRLLDVVVEILGADGYDAVQLREVARRARVSLSTIYKRYATRDELILAALEAWMEDHRYSGVTPHARDAGTSLYEALMDLFRTIFEPWEQHPGMLTAYFRARSSPASGQKLLQRGLDVVVPAGLELLAGVDDDFIADLNAVVASVVYGLLGRFSTGEIVITEILPTLDRTVYWLTAGYEAKRSALPVHARDVR
ncbi:TetR/AcrR family transcriptional regulator [Mycolicibacterium litorale]|uniref:TetR family transcriptional regulator n=1 Tax=Mycolicibacterium litorale TaxID=758802 RepID=A0AAD1MTC2_9MYCO|nr:TetR/AcrR family transcriptional regulator [Mycolicibacterium litorale]MCV7417011.1 TetR/AcrR family transcriptional regulator [Mycolicibacterium litorale]TDY04797.1 TetR family transcriptional regulator [Mycolicibacterium litorale]BBY18224.1 TetR family transcriptional regulator [Mycolicibacterium litorale]